MKGGRETELQTQENNGRQIEIKKNNRWKKTNEKHRERWEIGRNRGYRRVCRMEGRFV
jgi:hypothetical protein